jgi:restriction system protein
LNLADDLLERVKGSSPAFFERLVVDLLVRMGYGGSRKDAGRAIGKTGDGGIDGVIKEDELGLDSIYVQAKRYTVSSVPAEDLRGFVGALVGKRARKGVFLTTSSFSSSALQYARTLDNMALVLVDGRQLAALMVQFDVGTSAVGKYIVNKIDDDYFNESL